MDILKERILVLEMENAKLKSCLHYAEKAIADLNLYIRTELNSGVSNDV